MFARMGVLGRMAVRRVIAAARRAAFLADAQMDPTSADFHALIALTTFCVFDGRDSAEYVRKLSSAMVYRPPIRTAPDGRRRSRSNPRPPPTPHV